MTSGLFKENGIEKFEEFIYSVPPGKRADCLKAFVDRVGILQAELPTEEYEHNLLLEINSQLKKPFPDAVGRICVIHQSGNGIVTRPASR